MTDRGWATGTDLEIIVSYYLQSFGFDADMVRQQYAVRPEGCGSTFRLDFAWPDIKTALEADGWYHRSPEGAAKDAERDAWLRSDGWVIFRVDDRHGTEPMGHQLARVCQIVHLMLQHEGIPVRRKKK